MMVSRIPAINVATIPQSVMARESGPSSNRKVCRFLPLASFASLVITGSPAFAGDDTCGYVVASASGSADRLHLAGCRNDRRGAVVGDHDVVLVALLEPPLAADQRRLGHVLFRE